MAVPSENTLLWVEINGNQSHDELVRYIQAKQKEDAPIRQLFCRIHVREEEFGIIQDALLSLIESTSTLEEVNFSSRGSENVSVDAFLDAVSQNHSIHTVELFEIDCSADAIQKLMERKINWSLCSCRFIGHPSSCNKSTFCNVEELSIQDNDPSVTEFMAGIPSWPLLRQLSIDGIMGIPLDLQFVHLLAHIIRGAPILQELALHFIHFEDPDVLQSFSTLVFNAPSPDLKWHLYDCRFHPNMMAILENTVKSEKAKSMWIKLNLSNESWSRCNYQVLRTIMSESSCVGKLDLNDQNGDTFLEILPLLQEQPFPSTYYLCTSIHPTIRTEFLEQYHEILDSVQHWTPCMKKLFLLFAFYDNSSYLSFCTELIQAVWNNLRLQLVELYVKT